MSRLRGARTGLASGDGESVIAYAAIVRSHTSRWATDEEVIRPLPWDDVPAPYCDRPVSTRAITIDAPPDEVGTLPHSDGTVRNYMSEAIRKLGAMNRTAAA